MGLDMYARKMREVPDAAVDFEGGGEELHYWRKHPNLHGWMAKLYVRKGGSEAEWEFSGPVILTLDDLKELEVAVMNGTLPHTEGFFFGKSLGDEKEYDLEFIYKARLEIAKGWTVYYTSWW